MAALFTPKKMEVMLKNHLGSLEIAEELGISPESLDLELHKIYTSSKSFGDIQRRIRSNDKKSRKNSVKHPKFDDATSKSNHSITVNESDTLDTKTISTSETLDDVLSLIEKKQADLTNIERKHQAAVTKRTNLRNRLLNSKDELLKLQDRVSVIQSRINEILNEYEIEGQRMRDISLNISKCSDELKELQVKRDELSKISIYAYSNGKIEVNDSEVTDFPDEWKDVHQELFGLDILDDLTGSQIKQIAKLLAYTRTLESKFDICFEAEDMQTIFESLL